MLRYIATPPRGAFDFIFLERPSNTNPSGHLMRSLKWVSLIHIISNVFKNDCISSVRNLFFTPFIFHVKILKEVELSAASEKTGSGQL